MCAPGQECPSHLIKASTQGEQPVLALPVREPQEWLEVLPQREAEPGLAWVPQEMTQAPCPEERWWHRRYPHPVSD